MTSANQAKSSRGADPLRGDARTLCVVPCGKVKIWAREPERGPVPARDAYIRGLAPAARAYAERFHRRWVVLSARHGFLRPDDLVPGPYDVTFHRPGPEVIGAERLYAQAQSLGLRNFERVIVLADPLYAEAVRQALAGSGARIEAPLAGQGMRTMVRTLQDAVRRGCRLW